MTRLFGNGGGYKKAELVSAMARYFRKVRSMSSPADDQRKAKDWLPEAMQFPATDPDAPRRDQVEEDHETVSQAA